MLTLMRGNNVLLRYQQAKKKIGYKEKKSADEKEEEKNGEHEFYTEPPQIPLLKIPGFFALMREFWLNFIIRLAVLEFIAWFVIRVAAYITRSPTGHHYIIHAIANPWVTGIIFLVIALLTTLWKTWDWYKARQEEVTKLNSTSRQKEERELLAEIDLLTAKLMNEQYQVALLKTEVIPEDASTKILFQPLDMIDATNPANLAKLKNPDIKATLLEKLLEAPQFASIALLIAMFSGSLLPSRTIFISEGSISTHVIQTFLNLILIHTPFGAISGFSRIVIILLGLSYAIFHTYLQYTSSQNNATHARKKQARELAPLQKKCLQQQLEIITYQRKQLEAKKIPQHIRSSEKEATTTTTNILGQFNIPKKNRTKKLSQENNALGTIKELSADGSEASPDKAPINPTPKALYPAPEFFNTTIKKDLW